MSVLYAYRRDEWASTAMRRIRSAELPPESTGLPEAVLGGEAHSMSWIVRVVEPLELAVNTSKLQKAHGIPLRVRESASTTPQHRVVRSM